MFPIIFNRQFFLRLSIALLLWLVFIQLVLSSGLIGKMQATKKNQSTKSITQSQLFKYYNENKPHSLIIGDPEFIQSVNKHIKPKDPIALILTFPSLQNISQVLQSIEYQKADKIIIQWHPYFLSNIQRAPKHGLSIIQLNIWNRSREGLRFNKLRKDNSLFFRYIKQAILPARSQWDVQADNKDLEVVRFLKDPVALQGLIKLHKKFTHTKWTWVEDWKDYTYHKERFSKAYLAAKKPFPMITLSDYASDPAAKSKKGAN